MTEVSDPGNVSALSSEVEALIEEARHRVFRWEGGSPDEDNIATILTDLVRKALATVEPQTIRRVRSEMKADCEGAHSQESQWRAELQRDLSASREQARALAEALRGVDDHFGREYWTSDDGTTQRHGTPEDNECPRGTGELWRKVRAALASWDTSQKESRGEQSEGRGEGR